MTVAARDAWSAAYCHAFRTLFEVCGAAGLSDVDAPTSILFTTLAGQFAWHAELLFDLLPVREGVDREQLVRDAAAQLAPLDDELRRIVAGGDLASVCAVVAQLLVPGLLAAVTTQQSSTTARLEGPRARSLLLIGRDLADALVRLDAACEHLLALHPRAATPLTAVHEMAGELRSNGLEVAALGAPPNGRRP